MSRYIDADALLKCAGQAYDEYGVGLYVVGTGDILRMPTADVVEVVRCKECIHMGTDKCPSQLNDADFYCCQGERREDEYFD